jgi:hypothetical protein
MFYPSELRALRPGAVKMTSLNGLAFNHIIAEATGNDVSNQCGVYRE